MQHVSRWDRGGNGKWDRSRYTAFWEGMGGWRWERFTVAGSEGSVG